MTRWLALVLVITMLVAVASRPAVDAQEPSTIAWVGQSPPREGGIALLSTSRAIAADDLTASLRATGCNVRTIAVTSGGEWHVWVPGAPSIVQRDFPATLSAAQPFFVRCGDSNLPFQLTAEDSGTTITLDLRDRLEITLPGVPAAGTEWRVESPAPAPPRVLELVRDSGVTPEASSKSSTFEFVANGPPGEVSVRIVDTRATIGGESPPEWTARVLVRGQQPAAWYGHIVTGTYDPFLELDTVDDWQQPALVLHWVDDASQQAILDLTDTNEPALVWGSLEFSGLYGGAYLLEATTVLPASSTASPTPVEVVEWEGTIHTVPGGAQFDDYFDLEGPFPAQYGITGATPEVEAQLVAFRDTNRRVLVSGELHALVPDVHATQIVVTKVVLAP